MKLGKRAKCFPYIHVHVNVQGLFKIMLIMKLQATKHLQQYVKFNYVKNILYQTCRNVFEERFEF